MFVWLTSRAYKKDYRICRLLIQRGEINAVTAKANYGNNFINLVANYRIESCLKFQKICASTYA